MDLYYETKMFNIIDTPWAKALLEDVAKARGIDLSEAKLAWEASGPDYAGKVRTRNEYVRQFNEA